MLVDDGVHLARIEILEPAPAEILIRPLLAILALGEEARLHGLLFYVGFQFLGGFQFIQAPAAVQTTRSLRSSPLNLIPNHP